MLGKSISKNSFILGFFAVITAGILAATFLSTKDKIAEEERRAAQKALLEIVPRDQHDNDMLNSTWAIPEKDWPTLGLSEASFVHIATMNNEPVAVILPSTAPDGYSGAIKLIIGIKMDGSIAGVRALVHKETPGLGDKVDVKKHDWILSFNGKSLREPTLENWAVKKDGGEFDQFTGATITPRAVVQRVKKTLQYFEENKHNIIEN